MKYALLEQKENPMQESDAQSYFGFRLVRLKIIEFKGYCPNQEIFFSPGFNVIIGPNGAGKTTFLKLIEAAVNLDFETVSHNAYHLEFELEYKGEQPEDAGNIKGWIKSAARSVMVGQESFMSSPGQSECRLDIRGQGIESLVIETSANIIKATLNGEEIASEPTPYSRSPLFALATNSSKFGFPPYPILDTIHAFFVGTTYRRREGTEDYDDFTKSLAGEYSFFPDGNPLMMVGAEPSKKPMVYFQPESNRELLRCAFRLLQLREGMDSLPHIQIDIDKEYPGCERSAVLLKQIGIESLTFEFNDRVERQEEHGKVVKIGKFQPQVRLASGTKLAGDELTFGQKRFLVFAFVIGNNRDRPFLFDEMTNGLHARLVETLLKAMQQQQSFLTTHDRYLLDLLPFSSPKDLRQCIHFCARNEEGKILIRKLNEEESREVYRKVETEIMEPSEVLSAAGLW